MPALLEICVDTIEGCLAAKAGGADRVELCAALSEDGLTPSAGMIQTALRAELDVAVMIRPRGGDFRYAAEEAEAMFRDIAFAKAAGAGGVVLGALTAEGDIHTELIAVLAETARPMQVCFHRAFDQVRDPEAALETLIGLKIDRVLTSGGAPTAAEGLDALKRLSEQAAGRISILPGGGVRPTNAASILAATGATELHSSARSGTDTDVKIVRELAQIVGAA